MVYSGKMDFSATPFPFCWGDVCRGWSPIPLLYAVSQCTFVSTMDYAGWQLPRNIFMVSLATTRDLSNTTSRKGF
jgi:hypothetical protein